MSEINKTYRIKTEIGENLGVDYITLDANLVQDYESFDILSVKIDSIDTYKLHNANYGVVVGRVLANNGFGVPNAKLSIFISSDSEDGDRIKELYPFTNTASKNSDGVRYNLLPDNKVANCHQIVGTFPNKQFALDNDVVLEVYDKYYKYTTRTNNSGDYLIMGVPVGTHTLHMDLDLSDCGILSQRPRDFVYKGYTIEQFENPNMFKDGTNYTNLSQIFTQDQVVNVQPFWGNSTLGEKIGITRADINIAFKFEPTCVFMGSVVSDNASEGISYKCIATENMGNMEELVTGEGTIEMIRKTPGGAVEEFQVKGTQLINGNGVWCYQIPMNLDYMMTDEYGNMVPTDNPEKGIPTRTRVRFRVSMADNEENVDNFFRAKVLVPHNPQNLDNGKYEDYDYEFGSLTKDESFRDLFWNNVYSVKSYFPRFQKRKVGGWKNKKFTGIKNCNFYGSNNPMPYNNIRIKLPFMFTVMCAIIKVFIFIISLINTVISMLGNFLADIGDTFIGFKIFGKRIGFYPFKFLYKYALGMSMNVLKEGLCPDLENWYFSPMMKNNLWVPGKQPPKDYPPYDLLGQTLNKIRESSADDDPTSIDVQNNEEMDDGDGEPVCLTIHTDYLISCVEMNLAMEYRVINFDFYNDWINGTLYFPRFMRYLRPKKTFLGITFARAKIRGCMDDTKIFAKTRRYTQQCSIGFKNKTVNGRGVYTNVENPIQGSRSVKKANNLHKQRGLTQKTIFGRNGGICHEHTTLKGQFVYYMKPCEWTLGTSPDARKVNLYATDIILLGSLNDCDLNGIPQAFKYLSSTSYVMPTNLALTNMETNGYLYATGKGTICAGKSSLTYSDVRADSKINVIPPSCGLTAELLAYSGAQDSNYNVEYDGKELSDIIALTEAAGISWNYTGPGQGSEDPERMYHPGGHFLGLSCVNSQTNVKSCINLSRICEVGANMSQRKEDISSFDGEDGSLKYTYTVPSGFISGDDIVGANFRTMFATMNHNRLIATRTNPNTGYKMYDMDFIKPINFNGEFNNIAYNSWQYNTGVVVPIEDENVFNSVGIETNTNERTDHDPNEYIETQTRTIEETSVDYYLFRFGLKYNELTKSNQKHLRRFLINDGGKLFLPQYENSYYFYFGLKNGATAIDEFNTQFFSECNKNTLLIGEPTVSIYVDGDINICDATAKITINTTNLETPFQYVEILSDVKFINDGKELVKGILVKNGDDVVLYDHWLNSYSFELPEPCTFGTYRVTIRDANDVVYSKTEKIGLDVVGFNSTTYDFNSTLKGSADGKLIHKGGYIEVSNVKIDGLDEDVVITVFVTKAGEDKPISSFSRTTDKLQDKFQLGVNDVGEYELKVQYKCSESSKQVEFIMQSFSIRDTSGIQLFLGSPEIMTRELGRLNYYGWWGNNLGSDGNWIDRVSLFNSVKNDKRPEETSTIKAYAIGGNKVVWGHPQTSEYIYTDFIASNEGNCNYRILQSGTQLELLSGVTLPDGSYVDDEYHHWPTLKYQGKEVIHFSALAYNNNMVMGNYYGTLINEVLSVDKSKFNAGCGYIFKPVPEGDLQFHVYDGKTFKYNKKDDDGTDITNGLFYPSVSYPSIDRPFYAKTNFYCWSRRAVEMITDEVGESTPSMVDYEEGGKTEMEIHNGITYGNKFYTGTTKSTGSYATNVNFDDITVSEDDMTGVYEGKDRVVKINSFSGVGFTKSSSVDVIFSGTSGVSTYGYEVIGGASNVNGKPNKNGEEEDESDIIERNVTMSTSVFDVVDSSFADYVTFTTVTNENGSQIMVGPTPDGGNNSNRNVEYFLAQDGLNGGNLLSETPEKYIYIKQGERTFFSFATYTSAATYNTEGAPVLVKMTAVGFFGTARVAYSFAVNNEEGVSEIFSGDFSTDTTKIRNIFDKLFEKCNLIQGVRDIKIRKDPGADWCKLLENHKLTGETVYNPKETYYAYGVINGENDTKLYKIYPTIVKVSEFKDEDIRDITFVKDGTSVSEMTIEFDSNGGEKTIKIEKSLIKTWFSEYSGSVSSWCVVSPESSLANTAKITVEKNDTEKERTCALIFKYENSEFGAVLNVVQKGVQDPEE